jgi:hypothetical protein
MSTMNKLLCLFLILAAGVPTACARNGRADEKKPPTQHQQKVTVAGTYSSLAYHEEAGDLVGMEIKIIPLDGGFQGAVLLSEGEPRAMVLVSVAVQGTDVRFQMSGEGLPEWSFVGRVTPTQLVGKISYAEGGVEDVVLSRQCGYWDRHPTH